MSELISNNNRVNVSKSSLYFKMLSDARDNKNFDMKKITGMNSGKFGEDVIFEILNKHNVEVKRSKIILKKELSELYHKGYFQDDGFIPEFNLHIESKMLGFYSAGKGTANEKLPGFLSKCINYSSPVVIVLGGDFELDKTFESNVLLGCAELLSEEKNNNVLKYSFEGKAIKNLIEEGKLYVCRLSQFEDFILSLRKDV